MRYLFFVENPKERIFGININVSAKIASMILLIFELGLLISLLFMKVGPGTYVLSVIKFTGILCYFISILTKRENLAYISNLVFQIFIWLQLVVIVLLISFKFTLLKYAPSRIAFGLVFYIWVLSFQLIVELAFGFILFSFTKGIAEGAASSGIKKALVEDQKLKSFGETEN
jgi:hypothetical protein